MHGPIGFGVTAYDLEDALGIIRALDYGDYLPEDAESLRITAGVRYADLELSFVREHMGPIVVRGMWYPFRRVGM